MLQFKILYSIMQDRILKVLFCLHVKSLSNYYFEFEQHGDLYIQLTTKLENKVEIIEQISILKI